jgi:hypothetical protein
MSPYQQRHQHLTPDTRVGLGSWRGDHGVPVGLADGHEPVDDAGAFTQSAAELAAAGGAGGGDVLEANRLAGSVGAMALATFQRRLFLATGRGGSNTMWLWDPTTGHVLGPPIRHDARIGAVALTVVDGRLVLATSSQDTARLWDPINARQLVESLTLPRLST